jgi:hypothetical protein
MGMRSFRLLSALIVLAAGGLIYKNQIQSTSLALAGNARSTTRSAIDVAGVRYDLVELAKAERRHFAYNNKYLELEQLVDSGEISMKPLGRGVYVYSCDVYTDSFRITATKTVDEVDGPRRIFITQEMVLATE